MFKHYFFLLLGLLLLSRCVPANEEILTDVNFDLTKPEFQRFFDLQDQQLTDSLEFYFDHRDPSYRYAAAMAFASIKYDSSVINSLARLLDDDVEEVRIAAAYAMGQIGSLKGEKWLTKSFEQYDTLGIHHKLNATILEAIGKCGSDNTLRLLCNAKEYVKTDTLLLEGYSKAIYRFMLRGITSAEGTEKMVNFLTTKNYPPEVRMIAANYLGRSSSINIDTLATPLMEVLYIEKDPRVKMALVTGLGRTKAPEVLTGLLEILGKERDYRVKCNIISTLGNFEYRKVVGAIAPLLEDKNIQVATSAANYFLNYGSPQAAPQYRQIARRNDSLNWHIRSTLYRAANKNLSPYSQGTRIAIQYELKDQFKNATDVYQKAAALRSLGEYGKNYKDIFEMGFRNSKPLLRTTSIEALGNIVANPDFNIVFGSSRNRVKKELSLYFKEAIEKGDAAMMAVAAGIIRKPELDFKSVYDTLTFLEVGKNRLELPKETETLYEIQQTIDFFNGKKTKALPKPDFNHPINWRVFNTVNADTKAQVKTSKGTFVMEFFPNEAPGSVTNFISLAKSGFYDKKTFHRVIPNFVAQGGCPRGDGYGSLEYTIRSELPFLNYDKEGYVGMASAGVHTEGTQWFVTFSPTPHLDGRYTIFAKVIDGMDVVHQLTVGDKINQVQIVE